MRDIAHIETTVAGRTVRLPRIIGIAGKARSGKDTIAQYLIEHLHYMRVGMADPIKRFMVDGGF